MKQFFVSAAALALCAVSFNASAGGNIESGKALVTKFNCAQCHGADFNTPAMDGVPKLAGQHADYIEHALLGYQRGTGPNGRNNGVMGPQVNRKSADGKDEPMTRQDMKDIGAYLHSLPGSLVRHK